MGNNPKVYFPSSGSPVVSPVFDPSWYDTSSADRVAAVLGAPSSTTFATKTVTAPALPAPSSSKLYFPILVRQYVTPAILVTRANSTAYALGVFTTDSSGHIQQATIAGISGSGIPTWNDSGGTTTDGSVTWTDQGVGPLYAATPTNDPEFRTYCTMSGGPAGSPGIPGDVAGLAFVAPLTLVKVVSSSGAVRQRLEGSGISFENPFQISPTLWQINFNTPYLPPYPPGPIVLNPGDCLVYEIGYCIYQPYNGPQITAATGTVEFGDAAVFDLLPGNNYPWKSSEHFGLGYPIQDSNGYIQKVSVAGTSGGSAPTWSTTVGATTSDGSVTWTCFSAPQGNPWVYPPLEIFIGPPSPPIPSIPGAWLVINEPTIGITDRTGYYSFAEGDQNRFTLQLRQRGTATIIMRVKAGDSYSPTMGTQLWLFEVTATNSSSCVFGGTIDEIEQSWDGNSGETVYTVTAVSWQQTLDVLRIELPKNYINATCLSIIQDLFASVASGVPITIGGNVQAGLTIASQRFDGETVAAAIDTLAEQCEFVWGIDPTTQSLYFCPPTTVPAPTTLTSALSLWETNKVKQMRHDFRNRQIVRVSEGIMPQSSELFAGNGTLFKFSLLRPPKEIKFAWLTQSTQNSATGSMTGIPSPGDTVTISYPVNSSGYTWQHSTSYSVLGVAIIDPNGNVQLLTSNGTSPNQKSGASQPPWGTVNGDATSDFELVWTCLGALNSGVIGNSRYTFVTAIDNTVWGQVLIGATAAACLINLANAINQKQSFSASFPSGYSDWGTTYSLPTWENPQVNAYVSGTTITVKNKAAGAGYVAGLAASSSVFSWAAQNTSGGSTGATVNLAIATSGSSSTANLYWTAGIASVNCVSGSTVTGGPPPSGWNLQVQYFRDGGDCITVENTADVVARAAIENGTGKYQQLMDESDQINPYTALSDAQASLAAYGPQAGTFVFPTEFSVETLQPGYAPGQIITVIDTLPMGLGTQVNGTWFIEEVNGELIPARPYMPGFGHFRYTLKLINSSQSASYMDFWKQLVGA